MNECVETLFTEHKAVKCQYHKCLGLRIHCLKKVDWFQTAKIESISFSQNDPVEDPDKGVCDKLCSKVGKSSPHCSACHGNFVLFIDISSYTLVGSVKKQNAWVIVFLFSGESWQFSKHEIYSQNKNHSSVCIYRFLESFYRVWFTSWFRTSYYFFWLNRLNPNYFGLQGSTDRQLGPYFRIGILGFGIGDPKTVKLVKTI